MRLFSRFERITKTLTHQSGVTLLETIVALAIMSVITVTFLSGVATITKAAYMSDEQATAESLARTQLEWVKNSSYVYEANTYSAAAIPGGKDFVNYSVIIAASPINSPDDGIQKVTVRVQHSGKNLITLEGYKVDR